MSGPGTSPGAPAPVPAEAAGLSDLAGTLAELRVWAGSPSYARIADRIRTNRLHRGMPEPEAQVPRSTVYDCFRPARRRVDTDLVLEIVTALGADDEARQAWRSAVYAALHPVARAGVRVATALPDGAATTPLGRADELADLSPLRTSTLITGMAGVGKTALALNAAHSALTSGRLERLLWVNLDGFSTDRAPVDATTALDSLVRTLTGGAVPARDLRSTLHRHLAEVPTLLLLDNAGDQSQIEMLLPEPGSPSRALVTSRRRLVAPAVVELGPLPEADARRLLEETSGRSIDAPAGAELVAAAGGLPLALVLLGRRLAHFADWTLLDHLTAYRRRLDSLHLEEQVQAALTLSYSAVGPEAARALRLAAQVPVPWLRESTLSALWGTSISDTEALVRELSDAHLMQPRGDGWWELHDLVRAFARVQSLQADAPSAIADAITRLLARYADETAAAVAAVFPTAPRAWHWLGPDRRLPGPPLDRSDAVAWLRAEREAATTLALWAIEQGTSSPERDDALVRLVIPLSVPLWERGPLPLALRLQQGALDAVRRSGDQPGAALLRRQIAQTQANLGDNHAALAEAAAALEAALRLDDLDGAALCRLALSAAHHALDQIDEATAQAELAQAHFAAAGNAEFACAIELELGLLHEAVGRRAEAAACFASVAETAAEQGWPLRELWGRNNLVPYLIEAGDIEDAQWSVQRAMQLAQDHDLLRGEAIIGANQALVSAAAGDLAESRLAADRADRLAAESGLPEARMSVALTLGDRAVMLGDRREAERRYAEARRLADEIGDLAMSRVATEGLARLSG